MNDCTLLDYIKTLDADAFVKVMWDKHFFCRSQLMDGGRESSWKKYCLTSEYRGKDGCLKCKADMLRMTLGEIQEDLYEYH